MPIYLYELHMFWQCLKTIAIARFISDMLSLKLLRCDAYAYWQAHLAYHHLLFFVVSEFSPMAQA